MAGKNYELIEHTADIGIKVKASTQKELFQNASLAMFDIIAQKNEEVPPSRIKEFHIEQEAANVDELFVNWLNELLSLSSAKEVIFYEFEFIVLDENNLKVVALGNENRAYKINSEIKAATYHELEIKKSSTGWQAKVIFDV